MSLWSQHFYQPIKTSLVLGVFLITFFNNIYHQLINTDLPADGALTHTCVELIWHTCFSVRLTTAFRVPETTDSTSALHLVPFQTFKQWNCQKSHKKCKKHNTKYTVKPTLAYSMKAELRRWNFILLHEHGYWGSPYSCRAQVWELVQVQSWGLRTGKF